MSSARSWIHGIAYDGGWCFTNQTGTYRDGGTFKLKKSRNGARSEKILYSFEGKVTVVCHADTDFGSRSES
jgi:hypothetical protein